MSDYPFTIVASGYFGSYSMEGHLARVLIVRRPLLYLKTRPEPKELEPFLLLKEEDWTWKKPITIKESYLFRRVSTDFFIEDRLDKCAQYNRVYLMRKTKKRVDNDTFIIHVAREVECH